MKNLFALCGCLWLGCATNEAQTGETTQDLDGSNGIGLNGIGLNGIGLNGIGLNGVGLNGVGMNGIGLNGIGLNGIGLNGVGLNGIGLNGIGLNGVGLNGSTWTGQLSDGNSLELRIDSATTGSGDLADVGMFGVSYNTASGWQPLCGLDGSGAPVLALVVPGVWNLTTGAYANDSTQFTFACRGVTIAKCVEDGYKQWTHPTELQACVRMRRADYCGDGTPFTHNGQLIDFYDALGVQTDTEPSWQLEAEWTPDGARCVSDGGTPRFVRSGTGTPACISSGAVPTTSSCGASFAGGATLIEKLPPL